MASVHHAPPSSAHISQRLSRRTFIRLVVLALALYVVAVGFAGLRLSVRALGGTDFRYVGLAFIAVVMSYVFAALTLIYLARRQLRFGRTLLVLFAGGLVNRLLPGGLGGLGLNVFYLRKMGHTLPTATAIVTLNNFLGFVGNAFLIGVGVALTRKLPPLHAPHVSFWLLITVAVMVVIGIIVIARNRRYRTAGSHTLREMNAYLLALARRPQRIAMALVTSMGITASHATALYLVLIALHVPVPWLTALFAVSAGSVASVAVPTPGGIGATEAGIAGMLLLLGLPADLTIASALLYRGLTYWLPLAPGYLALRVVEKRYL